MTNKKSLIKRVLESLLKTQLTSICATILSISLHNNYSLHQSDYSTIVEILVDGTLKFSTQARTDVFTNAFGCWLSVCDLVIDFFITNDGCIGFIC